jgi:hypothetical protein
MIDLGPTVLYPRIANRSRDGLSLLVSKGIALFDHFEFQHSSILSEQNVNFFAIASAPSFRSKSTSCHFSATAR